jgi:aromatic ring-opening dioxygenase catalytic subunit (LigB family)
MPTLFIPHGGGPWPFVDLGGFIPKEDIETLRRYFQELPGGLGAPPRALLVVSAHWEEREPTVMTASHPSIYYDYYGFPPDSYTLAWPAPGDPELAGRTADLLRTAGFRTAEDPERGYDHGTFVPLKLSWPRADIPTVQLSLKSGLDPEEHLAMGRALTPLREDGVLILGSGMSYHNLRAFGTEAGRQVSLAFDAWLRSAATAAPRERDGLLRDWTSAPGARQAHPRAEHLLPLMVAAGAAGEDSGSVAFNGDWMGTRISAVRFG